MPRKDESPAVMFNKKTGDVYVQQDDGSWKLVTNLGPSVTDFEPYDRSTYYGDGRNA